MSSKLVKTGEIPVFGALENAVIEGKGNGIVSTIFRNEIFTFLLRHYSIFLSPLASVAHLRETRPAKGRL